MGNRAVITTKENYNNNGTGIYVHWNGGIESVEAFLAYCRLKEFRCPEDDNYGWAYLTTVIGNFFGTGLSVGVGCVNELASPDDNGTYFIKGWRVVGRTYELPLETDGSEMYERLVEINKAQGPALQVDEEVIKQFCEDNGFPM